MTAPLPNSSQPAESTDLRDYFRPIWAHKFLILVLVAVATVGTYVYYDRKPRLYESSTQIFIGTPSGDATATGTSDRTLANQARLLTTPEVATRVARKIKYQGDPRALLGGISVNSVEGADFVTITSTAADAQAAALLANAFAEAFIDLRESDQKQQADSQLKSLRQRLEQAPSGAAGASLRSDLQDQITELEVTRSTQLNQARQIDEARASGVPIAPKPRRNALFAFALSLLVGIIAAFGLERIDRRLRSVDEASRAFGLPVIAAIPHDREIAHRRGQEVAVAEGVRETFRSLRSNLEIAVGKGNARTILVTSAVPAEGKSTIVRNLALVYAEAGLRVVIVEADLRRPTLAKALAVEPTPGLTDVLMGLVGVDDALQTVRVDLPEYPRLRQPDREFDHGDVALLTSTNGGSDGTGHLRLLASGPKPADPPAMFTAPSLEALIRNLGARHDVVLVDSPPLLAVSDAVPLMSIADGTVLVCRIGESTQEGAARVLNLVNRVPEAHMLGLVVNDVESGFGERYGAY